MKMKNSTQYASELNSMFINSAKSILDIANIFVEAKENLDREEYAEFLKLTKYSEKSASVRKWQKIGESSIRLETIVDRLPANWSTVYEIAKLHANDFDALVKSDVLNTDVTVKEIKQELKNSIKKNNIRITLSFDSEIDIKEFEEEYTNIKQSISNNLVKIKLSKDAEQLIASASNNSIYKSNTNLFDFQLAA